MKCRLAVWAAILLALVSATAEAAFYIEREGRFATLLPEISYRIDDGKASTFEAISSQASGWLSQKEKPFKGTADPVSLWIRFDIPPAPHVKRAFVNIPLWEREEFFVVRDGVLVDRQKAGMSTPWNERATHVTMMPTAAGGFVAIDLPPGSHTTVFAHLQTHNRDITADYLMAGLWDAERVLDGERRDRIFQGVFYGVMLFLLVYNFGLFVVVREPSYLYYVVMEAAFAMTWAAAFGLTFEYVSPGHPDWEFHYVWLGGIFGGFGLWQFLRHYLATARNFPRVDVLLKTLVIADLVCLPVTFLPIPSQVLSQIIFYGTPISAAVLIGVTGLALKRRHPSALSLLLAMTCLGVGFTVFAGAAMGVLPKSDFTFHAGQIGSALAGIILSLGLGFRLQNERMRLARLKRFLSPKVSELIAAGQLDDPLVTRRREVTIVFVDLRGFTAFSETAAPEDVLGVLREYHAEVGRLVSLYDGTVEHFAGDGVMLIFNDPAPLPDPALAAVRMAVELRDSVARLAESWRKLGYQLGCGLGIAQGYATIGTIGFPGRQDYGVVGAVNNLAARLCAQAAAGQVLVSQRVFGRVEDKVVAEPVGELTLKGIQAPVMAYNVIGMKAQSADTRLETELSDRPTTQATAPA